MERKILVFPLILTVFLALPVGVGAEACGVYIHDIDVVDNIISFNISNTGVRAEDIEYVVYMGLDELARDNLTLDINEGVKRMYTYDFLYGNYQIKVQATADCGLYDIEEMTYSVLEPLPKICSDL